MATHLPIVGQPHSSLGPDGRREVVHPADVSGRFTRARNVGFVGLIALWAALPWITLGGHPAVLLDIEARRFYLLGATFNAQDIWLTFFLVTGAAFALLFLTAVAGRVWCGYACPQTVFLEGVYRRIERWTDGPRVARQRLAASPMSGAKLVRRVAKHAAFVAVSLVIARIVVSYFAADAILWTALVAAPLYLNYAFFREQVCLIVCPYGRMQSALTDADTLTIAYDAGRGEPRGKASDPTAGACVDCNRCVAVCPTGIDIRNGLQLDCIGCAACVDACDDVMDRLERPRGLVRYASTGRFLRPRIALYGVLGAVGLVVALSAARGREPFEANLLRLTGAPYVLDGDQVRNTFELHLVNKSPTTVDYELVAPGVTLTRDRVTLPSLASARVPLVAVRGLDAPAGDVVLEVRSSAPGQRPRTVRAPFLGPRR